VQRELLATKLENDHSASPSDDLDAALRPKKVFE
jgi:hypothetical protein